MKPATDPDAAYITTMAMSTAAIMTSMSCAMPIAVMIESIENTRSMTTELQTTKQECAAGRRAGRPPRPRRASISA